MNRRFSSLARLLPRLMPRLLPRLLPWLLAALAGSAMPAGATPSLVSINFCTDQLLLAMADPDQVKGLSPYARNPGSWRDSPLKPVDFPRLSGTAEEVMLIRPGIVLAGRFTKRATREFLATQGLRVETFDVPQSLEDVRADIRRMGTLTGHPARAEALVSQLDGALSEARAAAARHRWRVLPLQRRGWVSGSRTLISSIMAELGLGNAAAELNISQGALVGIETIVALKPDALLMGRADGEAQDQGLALLQHPALARLIPRERVISLPDSQLTCGGPGLTSAIRALSSAISRLNL